MVKKMKSTQASMPVAIGIGIVAALILSTAMAALMAFLMSSEKLQVSSIPVCTAITHLLSAFLGTWVACLTAKEKHLITSGITVLGYILQMLVGEKYGGKVMWDELGLPCTESGMALPCGATGRWMSE